MINHNNAIKDFNYNFRHGGTVTLIIILINLKKERRRMTSKMTDKSASMIVSECV